MPRDSLSVDPKIEILSELHEGKVQLWNQPSLYQIASILRWVAKHAGRRLKSRHAGLIQDVEGKPCKKRSTIIQM